MEFIRGEGKDMQGRYHEKQTTKHTIYIRRVSGGEITEFRVTTKTVLQLPPSESRRIDVMTLFR